MLESSDKAAGFFLSKTARPLRNINRGSTLWVDFDLDILVFVRSQNVMPQIPRLIRHLS